jgi:translation initiation factor IF-1
VEVAGGPAVLAHPGGGLQRNFVRLLVGDRVMVELMPRDLTRGRIVKRLI